MKKIITTPITYEQIRDLEAGDTVYLSGRLATCRDSGHRRVVKEGVWPENFTLRDGAIFHAGPIVREGEDGEYTMVSIGPTTSRRMESIEGDFIRETGVRMIIGKGGMMEDTAAACREYGAIHCAFPGGCAVMAAERVTRIIGAEWKDLGMPEAFWEMEVSEFGPLVVSIDTRGNNLFAQKKEEFSRRMEAILSGTAADSKE